MKKKLQKAALGLQKIQADTANKRSLLSGGLQSAAGAIPGYGSAISAGLGLLEAGSSALKDDNGLYKSKAGQFADGLNPVTALSRASTVVGGIFSGKAFRKGFDIDGQQAIKDAMAKQKIQAQQQQTWDSVGLDIDSTSQTAQYPKGAKSIKVDRSSKQDSTSPQNMYKGGSTDSQGGFDNLKSTTKGATAILGLAKAIPTPLTQAIGWGASGVSAMLDTKSAYDNVKKGNYVDAAVDAGQAALSLVPLNISKAGKVGKSIDLLKKGSKARTVRDAGNIGVRALQGAALTSDASDIKNAATYREGTKAIEIEGGEPHFSKKVNGKRILKSYSPDGPSHQEGGIPVIASEGDAIVTAKKNLGGKAVAAYAAGDHKQVEKIIKQMPTDKGQPKALDGIRRARAKKPVPLPDLSKIGNPSIKQQAFPLGDTGADLESRMNVVSPYMNVPKTTALPEASVTAPKSAATGVLGKAQGVGTNLLQAAPTAYNIGQGLFGKVDKTTRRSYTPTLQQYEDLSGGQRLQSIQAMKGGITNARNLSGGNAGNARSNAKQAITENFQNQANIDSQEAGRKLNINAANAQETNRAKLINNQMNDQADVADMQNAAKKSEALSRGLEGISALTSNKLLMKNQGAADEQNMGYLKQMYKNYTIGPDGKIVLKAKKGLKNIKTK